MSIDPVDISLELHLYAVGNEKGDLYWCVTTRYDHTVRLTVDDDQGVPHMFSARANHLQQWCAKRKLGYQHQVLHIPAYIDFN